MEIGKFISSILSVYAVTFIVGMIISISSSGIQCQKVDMAEHAKEGAIWATYPTIVYGLTTYFPVLRRFAVNTLQSYFRVGPEYVEIVAVGYLMMLISWVATVWNLHNTEKSVCNPSVDEMSRFKENVLKRQKEKQEAEQKSNEAKQNPPPTA